MYGILSILAASFLLLPSSYAETAPSGNHPETELAPVDSGLTAEQKKALRNLYASAAFAELTALLNIDTRKTDTRDPSIDSGLHGYFRSLALTFCTIADSPELDKLPQELRTLMQATGKKARTVTELLEPKTVDKPRLAAAVHTLEQARHRQNEYLLQKYGINEDWLRACAYHRLALLQSSIAYPKGFFHTDHLADHEGPDSNTALQMAYDALLLEPVTDIPLHSDQHRHIIEYNEARLLNSNIHFLQNMHTRWKQHVEFRMEWKTMPDASRLPQDLQTIIAEERTLLQALRNPNKPPFLMKELIAALGNKQWEEERRTEWDRNYRQLFRLREEYSQNIEKKTKGEAGSYHVYTMNLSATLLPRYLEPARKALNLPSGETDPWLSLLSLPPKQQEQLWERACLMLCEEWQKNGSPR